MDHSHDASCLDFLYPPGSNRSALFRRDAPLLQPSCIEPRAASGLDAGSVDEWAWEAGVLSATGDAHFERRDADASEIQ